MKNSGRGTDLNPKNRFETLDVQVERSEITCDDPDRKTLFFKDKSKSILATNDSPDIPFDSSLNVYRGCEHGCIYCYARPSHEYLGFSSGLDFETRIMVKQEAPELLRKKLSSKTWQPQIVSMGANTDPYQPVERQLQITRKCLEVFLEFQNPVGIVTKSHLILRDVDLLKKLSEKNLVSVFISVTSLDPKLSRVLEPRASYPQQRLKTIKELSDAGIRVGSLVAPIIPAINEHEIPAILKTLAENGAATASYVLLRLPYAIKDLFSEWLEKHFPDRKQKVLNRLLALRGGKLNDPRFGKRMTGQGEFAEQISQMFKVMCKKYGLNQPRPPLRTDLFKNANSSQLQLL